MTNATTNAASNQQLEPELFPCPLDHPIVNGLNISSSSGMRKWHITCFDCGLCFEGQLDETARSLFNRWNSRVSDGGVVATVDQMWEALKTACCKNPAKAKLAVFVGEKKFKEALAPFTVTTARIRDEIVKRISIARAEKQSTETSGYGRDALRLDGAIGVLENLLEDIDTGLVDASPAAPKEEALSGFAPAERLSRQEDKPMTKNYDDFRAGMLRAAEMARSEFKRAPEAAKGHDCVYMSGYEDACDHLSVAVAQAAVIDSVRIAGSQPDWQYHIALLFPDGIDDQTLLKIYQVVEHELRATTPSPDAAKDSPEVICSAAAIEISRAIIDGLPIDDKGGIAAIIQRHCFSQD